MVEDHLGPIKRGLFLLNRNPWAKFVICGCYMWMFLEVVAEVLLPLFEVSLFSSRHVVGVDGNRAVPGRARVFVDKQRFQEMYIVLLQV